MTHHSTAQPQGQNNDQAGTLTQVHFSLLANVLLAPDFHCRKPQEGVSHPFPKDFQHREQLQLQKRSIGLGEETTPKSKQCGYFVNIQEI